MVVLASVPPVYGNDSGVVELKPEMELSEISNGAVGVTVTLPAAGVRPVPLTTIAWAVETLPTGVYPKS
jgi:hypothetical protein